MRSALRAAVEPFECPSVARACWQLFSSLGFYVVALILMYRSLELSYWLTLVLALPASGFLVRTFIVQHDCGHSSFFGSRRANDIVGTLCSVFTLAPYQNWRRQHSQHHANWNNLDRREHGADIYTSCLTVNEYRALSPLRRLLYRLPRHPLPAHFIYPPLVFLLLYRFPFDTPRNWTAERRSVWLTNIGIASCILLLGARVGFHAVMLVQLPIVAITTIAGVWLFSVQHRFETARWLRGAEWNFQTAALTGSSYLKLPRWLQWMTGNIGFHHIHHLSPRIPNYRLADCYRGAAILREQPPLTLFTALRASTLTLWDEAGAKLVRFKDAIPVLR
ncbi:MAG TPA: fatty acid desaturase [Rhizomicrobium sp.]|nr:fatty acid desaturase [Rhizomicrobium sp.]